MTEETFLGDGLYASYDGFQLTLRAPRNGIDHYVCLESVTMLALVEYLAQLHRELQGLPLFMVLRGAVQLHAGDQP